MKPTLTRPTLDARPQLVLAPRMERVVDRERQFELAVVTEIQEVEAFGYGEQSPRLRRGVAVVAHVGPVHDSGEQRQGGIIESA